MGSSLYILQFVSSISNSKAALIGLGRGCLPYSSVEADTCASGHAQVKARGDLFDRERGLPAQYATDAAWRDSAHAGYAMSRKINDV